MNKGRSRPAANEAADGSAGRSSESSLERSDHIVNDVLDLIGVSDDEQLCYATRTIDKVFSRESCRVAKLRRQAPPVDRDVYVGLVVLDGSGGVSEKNAVRVLAIWADIDVRTDIKPTGMPTWVSVEAVVAELARLVVSDPSVVIESGHGLQPVWLLEAGDTRDVPRIARALKRFGALVQLVATAHGGTADTVFDLARVLRMPGTVNHKVPGDPVKTGLRVTGGRPLSLDEIEEVLDAYDVPLERAGKKNQSHESTEWPWAAGTCSYVQAMVDGWQRDAPKAGRHSWAFSQQIRLSAARRLGCISEADNTVALLTLQSRMDELRASDGLRPDEVALDTKYAVAIVESKSEQECLSELAEHDHAASSATDSHRRTDRGNAHRFVELALGRVLWNPAMGWLVWDGRRWARGMEHEVDLLAQRVADTIAKEADEMDRVGVSREEVARHRRWAKDSESANRVRALKTMAQPHLFEDPEAFDSNPDLLNLVNGVLCLRTFTLLPHNPDLRITRLAPTSWDSTARAPHFEKVLARVQPDPAMRTFLQSLLGYGITGHTGEQIFAVHWGSGGNGKSTILNCVRDLLGEYGGAADPATFAKKDASGSAASPDRAALAGLRMVTCIEPNQLRLDPTFVKTITGGDPVVARELYKAPFTYRPQFLLNMVTNDKPAIDDGTDGMWRRIVLVPWTVQVPEDERLPEHLMTEKLRVEKEGILNWLLDGCRTWRANGLPVPDAVRSATEDYRRSEDVVLTFLTESGFRLDPEGSVRLQGVTDAWDCWSRDNREAARSIGGPRKLQARLVDNYGATVLRRNSGRAISGIAREDED